MEVDGFFSSTVCVTCGSADIASREEPEWFDLSNWSDLPKGLTINSQGFVEDPWGNELFKLRKGDTVYSVTDRLNSDME
jgi:hypothetical protein